MKQVVKLLVLLALCPELAQATSLNGTASIVYQDKHYVFRNFNTAKGYVRLNNGFTILAGQSAALDTFYTVSGSIDLRTTGSLDLRGDLYLDSKLTWSSSGKIYGRGNTIHLGGSLSLPTDTIVEFIDNTIIDGHGHTLTLGAHAQLLLASDVSLTLKNMTIQTTRNSSNIPIIRCFDQKGHVTLDNVELALADDFAFRTGRMFCFNDVRFTGTSQFIYQSVMQSYVAPKSLLTFDPGTTLYYYPSTTDKDLLQLNDKSSGIYLKGSGTTLQTTFTGMRLTKGRLWLDNKIDIETKPTTKFLSLTETSSLLTSGSSFAECVFSPNARYVATISYLNANFRVLKVTATGLELVASYVLGGTGVYSVDWDPTGRFIAVGVIGATGITVFRFDGASLTPIASVGGQFIVAWSPCGNYLAGMNTGSLTVYSFSGYSLTAIATVAPGAGNFSAGRALMWSPNGRYLALYYGSFSPTTTSKTYLFDGTSLTQQSSHSVTFSAAFAISSQVAWRSDGLFFAITTYNSSAGSDPALMVYSFNGFTQNLIASASNSFNTTLYYAVDWSPDGRYVAVGGAQGGGVNNIRIFEFNGTSLTSVYTYNVGLVNVTDLRFSADGKKLLAGVASSPNEILVFDVAYTTESASQALTNGLTLGNSSLGSSFDLDAYVLSGATVNLAGQLFYDSTS
ncbi:hypothetical protein K2W90_04955 [Candidatus Babeliales bacterium]|nr:hypothetical protein [Candidatus Babeliales bacterium]